MIHVLFLISSLSRGGAQRQLTLLVKEIDRTRFAVTVVTLYECGPLCAEIAGLDGVQVYALRGKGRWRAPATLWRLWHIVRRAKPDIVHGYMDVANIVALALGKAAHARVVWGLRASNVDYAHYGRRPAFYFRLAARLSRFSDLIVANSYAGRRHHVIEGFAAKNLVVIPNGFDTERFRPDPAAGRQMRRAWGVPNDARLIGIVARLDPMKEHRDLLRAAALLAAERCDVHFVCIGDGSEAYRHELQAYAGELGLAGRVIWAGEVTNMPAAQNALDIATSATARGEGFSNAIGEAMACGVPCVATDVGDSAMLVGDAGLVVPPGDPEALAAAWRFLLDLASERRQELRLAARERVMTEFSLANLARRTEAELARLMTDSD